MDAGPPPDDARALLAKDAKLRRGVVAYAYKRLHTLDLAGPAAQEAMTLVLEGQGWRAWDPRGGKTLFSHLCSVVDSVVANERAKAHRRREISAYLIEDEGIPAYYANTEDPQPNIEQRVVEAESHQERMRLAGLVMGRLDEMARAMLNLEQVGVSDASEQATRLGCTVKDIYRARERVAHHRDAVLADDEASAKKKKDRGTP
jgi:hypothetical protein